MNIDDHISHDVNQHGLRLLAKCKVDLVEEPFEIQSIRLSWNLIQQEFNLFLCADGYQLLHVNVDDLTVLILLSQGLLFR